MALLSLAKGVAKAVIPAHTLIGKAVGSTNTSKGVNIGNLLPEGSKAQKLVNQIDKTSAVVGNLFNPVPSAKSVEDKATGGVASLFSSPSSTEKIDNAYRNEINAKTAQAAVSTASVPAGALAGKSIPFGSGGENINGKKSTNVLALFVVGFVLLKSFKII